MIKFLTSPPFLIACLIVAIIIVFAVATGGR